MKQFDHEADGEPVLTIVGADGVRWACCVCNETVFRRGPAWLHFGEAANCGPGAHTVAPVVTGQAPLCTTCLREQQTDGTWLVVP